LGNHDTYYKNTNEINSLYELLGGPGEEKYPNIHCYDAPLTEEFDGTGIHLCLGFVLKTMNTMRSIEMTSAQFVWGILKLNGFEMHAGHFAESGYDKDFLKSLILYSLDTFTRSLMMAMFIILVTPIR
jgi:hypothetical protein